MVAWYGCIVRYAAVLHIRPAAAKWSPELSEFILMYDDVRAADSPEETLYEFLASTYEAGATLGKWDRAALEL